MSFILTLAFLSAGANAATPAGQASGAGAQALQSQRLVAPTLDAARDMTGDRRVILSAETPRTEYFVREPIRLRVRVSVDRRFLDTEMVQLFPRPLDVPVQLQARWLDNLPGAILMEAEAGAASSGPRATFALNETIAQATRAPDDLTGAGRFTVIEIERTYYAPVAGELTIPESLLYFAYATRFEEDFLNGRVAKDRVGAFVRSTPLVLEISPLPKAGRPVEFTGAVGRFSIEADVTPRVVAVGESLKLSLRIEGQGNLQGFDAPTLRELEGFTIYGMVESPSGSARVLTYDIAPLRAGMTEIPELAFAYFDPNSPAGYRTVKTAPLRIDVHPAAEVTPVPSPADAATSGSSSNAGGTRVVRSGTSAPGQEEDPGFSTALWIALIVSLATVLLFVVRKGRRASLRTRPPIGHDERDPTL